MVTKTSSGSRTRLPAAARRAQILGVARDLFVADGLERTSLRRIATAAGITPTAIYGHFADKEALFFAIGQDFFQGLIDRILAVGVAIPEPLPRLRGLMSAYVRFGLEHPQEYRLIFMTSHGGIVGQGHRISHRGPTEPAEQHLNKGAIAFGLLEGEVARLTEAGVLRPGPPATVAEVVWAAGHGLVALLITHGAFDWTPVDSLIETALDRILFGIVAPGPDHQSEP